MDDDLLLEPAKAYKQKYQKLHEENTIKYFDELAKKGNVDVALNKETCTKYYNKLKEIDELNSKIGKYNLLKGLLISLMAVVSTSGIVLLVLSLTGNIHIAIGIVVLVVAILLDVGGVFLIKKNLNKKIKNFEEIKQNEINKANALKNEALAQMDGLNSKYDWNIAAEIFEITIPLFQMDQYFDIKKYQYLHDKYNLSSNDEQNVSTYFCQSGSILGNPFLLCKDYKQDMSNKEYTGTLTIHWTTRVKTKEGYRTEHHSQTLVATIYKPAPVYSYQTYLIYGNDAAPKLEFSRLPSNASGKSEREIDKIVKNRVKDLDKLAKNAVNDGKNYTRFGNDEFEALFGGENRNNEVEYRLLFTPLAQKNLLELIKDPEPYGDDFIFQKDRQLNYIMSRHSQVTDYYSNPANFIDFDYERAKEKFINYNKEYFKALYYDFAPLISIPLYQQHKSFEYIYDKEYDSNISCYEHEVMANRFDTNLFKPDNSSTPLILKTNLIRKSGSFDEVNVVAHSFEAMRRVTYVPKLGGDGRIHNVPVYWLEYIPVSKESKIAVENLNSSRFEFNNQKYNPKFTEFINKISVNNGFKYERGLFATILLANESSDSLNGFNDLFKTDSSVEKLSTEEIIRRITNEFNDSVGAQKTNIESEQETLLHDESKEAVEVELNEDELESTGDNPEDNIKEKGE